MITIRKSSERGHIDHGWLKTSHTFSFGEYFDPKHKGFGLLRVINEDVIAKGQGFGTHPHQDMEIITYMVEGVIEHKDSMGNIAQIKKGEVQCMSAGSGIQHSEYNPSLDTDTHLLQIWIHPSEKNIKPSYSQKDFSSELAEKEMVLLVSSAKKEGALFIHQDASIFAGNIKKAGERTLIFERERRQWVQVIKGELELEQVILNKGDGAGIENQTEIHFKFKGPCEFLLFDLP